MALVPHANRSKHRWRPEDLMASCSALIALDGVSPTTPRSLSLSAVPISSASFREQGITAEPPNASRGVLRALAQLGWPFAWVITETAPGLDDPKRRGHNSEECQGAPSKPLSSWCGMPQIQLDVQHPSLNGPALAGLETTQIDPHPAPTLFESNIRLASLSTSHCWLKSENFDQDGVDPRNQRQDREVAHWEVLPS